MHVAVLCLLFPPPQHCSTSLCCCRASRCGTTEHHLCSPTPAARCIDLDCDGVLRPKELSYFYEEQMKRLEHMAQEAVTFEDVICQLHDMLQPAEEGCYTLQVRGSLCGAEPVVGPSALGLQQFWAAGCTAHHDLGQCYPVTFCYHFATMLLLWYAMHTALYTCSRHLLLTPLDTPLSCRPAARTSSARGQCPGCCSTRCST
jgi:hypothetical protein